MSYFSSPLCSFSAQVTWTLFQMGVVACFCFEIHCMQLSRMFSFANCLPTLEWPRRKCDNSAGRSCSTVNYNELFFRFPGFLARHLLTSVFLIFFDELPVYSSSGSQAREQPANRRSELSASSWSGACRGNIGEFGVISLMDWVLGFWYNLGERNTR